MEAAWIDNIVVSVPDAQGARNLIQDFSREVIAKRDSGGIEQRPRTSNLLGKGRPRRFHLRFFGAGRTAVCRQARV